MAVPSLSLRLAPAATSARIYWAAQTTVADVASGARAVDAGGGAAAAWSGLAVMASAAAVALRRWFNWWFTGARCGCCSVPDVRGEVGGGVMAGYVVSGRWLCARGAVVGDTGSGVLSRSAPVAAPVAALVVPAGKSGGGAGSPFASGDSRSFSACAAASARQDAALRTVRGDVICPDPTWRPTTRRSCRGAASPAAGRSSALKRILHDDAYGPGPRGRCSLLRLLRPPPAPVVRRGATATTESEVPALGRGDAAQGDAAGAGHGAQATERAATLALVTAAARAWSSAPAAAAAGWRRGRAAARRSCVASLACSVARTRSVSASASARRGATSMR